MEHRSKAACLMALLAIFPLAACADGDAASDTAAEATGVAVEPGPDELIAAMQADFITDLSRDFGPAVGESGADGQPNFEVLAFDQASMEPLDAGCWRYTGEVTTVMRGVLPLPSENTSAGEFTACRQDGVLVVTEKAMGR